MVTQVAHKPFHNAYNLRSEFVIHCLSKEEPTHKDTTLCGIPMKGKRWHLTDRPTTCADCLSGAQRA